MRDKFKGIYRIESARKPNWDYSWDGMYYVTICTGGRELFFGEVVDERILLSEIGIIANDFWLEIPKHFKFVELDSYQIMPNHVHGLIKIEQNPTKKESCSNKGNRRHVETLHATSLQGSNNDSAKIKNEKMANISPKKGSLSTVIRSFKSAVTKEARLIEPEFYWQSRFHDSIVRDDVSLNNIREYITKNPKNWAIDELNL